MDDSVLLGVCGLYCGACDHFRAFVPESAALREACRAQNPAFEECHGCRTSVLTTTCSRCKLRACAEERGIAHCGLCAEYPCAQLRAFQHDGKIHHIPVMDNLEALREQGAGPWLASQRQRWVCSCGMPFSWYETDCSRCGAPLPSYGPRPEGR